MIKLLLFVVLLMLVFVGVLGAVLHHFFGWKGWIAFPVILLVLLWGGKFIIGRVIKKFALSLFSMKSRVLRGATLEVHGIEAVPEPPKRETAEPEPEDQAGETAEAVGEPDEADEPEESAEPEEPEGPKHYFAVDLTITPAGDCGENIWEPGELILTSEKISSLEDLDDGKEVGRAEDVFVWDGAAFQRDDACKYPGPQRLKVTFAVKPGTSRAWVQYYNEGIGELKLPPWTVSEPQQTA